MVCKLLEIVSSLLASDERQQVLGDIQERGADLRALFDLLGLVLLRQFQDWASWRTWLLTASLLLPAFAVVNGAHALADTTAFYPWPGLTPFSRPEFALMILNSTISTIVLGWVSGYTLAAIGRVRAFAMLPPLVLIPVWLLNAPLSQTWHHTRSAILLVLSFALIAAVPVIAGLRRGLRGTPLAMRTTIALGLLCMPFASLLPNSPYWSAGILNFVAFWPAFYAIIPPQRLTHAL